MRAAPVFHILRCLSRANHTILSPWFRRRNELSQRPSNDSDPLTHSRTYSTTPEFSRFSSKYMVLSQ